jgi:hypothetical protein
MKKVILTGLILSAFLQVEARTRIIRHGSADGIHYNRVNESHGWFNHTLTCTNPGAIKCGWTSPHRVIGNNGNNDVADIERWVEDQIAAGNLSGSAEYGNTGIQVTWSSEGTDRDITIEDYAG